MALPWKGFDMRKIFTATVLFFLFTGVVYVAEAAPATTESADDSEQFRSCLMTERQATISGNDTRCADWIQRHSERGKGDKEQRPFVRSILVVNQVPGLTITKVYRGNLASRVYTEQNVLNDEKVIVSGDARPGRYLDDTTDDDCKNFFFAIGEKDGKPWQDYRGYNGCSDYKFWYVKEKPASSDNSP